jgi:hypothetical protein
MKTTRPSTKGQIILPQGIRVSRAWGPGTEFAVEETDRFPASALDDVAGALRSKRTPKTRSEMRAVTGSEVKRRHDRGRY